MTPFRVDQRVYESRLSRMRQLIQDNAPPIVIHNEVKYILASWRPTLAERIKGWLLKILWRCRVRLP